MPRTELVAVIAAPRWARVSTKISKVGRRLVGYVIAGFYCHSVYKRDDPHPDAEAMFLRWAAKGIKTFHEVAKEKNMDLIGVFNCMGSPSPDIQTFIHTVISTDENEWPIYKATAVKHPSPKDLDAIRDFADQIINLIQHEIHLSLIKLRIKPTIKKLDVIRFL